MVDKYNFWRGKSVFITGHTGFKGSWLSLWLSKLGANVRGYSLAAEEPKSLFKQARVENYIQTHVIGNILDKSKLEKAINHAAPDIIFHLAAQPLVLDSYLSPLKTFEVNVQGTGILLDIARKMSKKCAILVITSDKCYENNEWPWPYREVDRLGGSDPYSASKACAELLVNSFRKSYFSAQNDSGSSLGLASARAGNVIGGCDWAKHRLVPDFFRALTTKNPLKIRNPSSTRPWQGILECLGGYLALGEKLYIAPQKFSEAWNFGPTTNDIFSVEYLCQKLNELCASRVEIEHLPPTNISEHQHLTLDISKTRNLLEWRPNCSINNTLENLVACYLASDDPIELRSVIEKQIEFQSEI